MLIKYNPFKDKSYSLYYDKHHFTKNMCSGVYIFIAMVLDDKNRVE